MTDEQFGIVAGLLTEIRDALAYLAGEAEAAGAPSEPEVPRCEHPEKSRTDFSTLRETHWVCGECGYEHRLSAPRQV